MACFTNANEVHNLFIEGRTKFVEGFVKYRYRGSNAWQGRLREKPFPVGHGTVVRGHKLGRMSPPRQTLWRKIVDGTCQTNACSYNPQTIKFPGSYDYEYGIQQTELMTDWLCLDSFVYKHSIAEEIAHLEDQINRINRFVEEDFSRIQYIDHAENKWVGLLPPNDEREYCAGGCFPVVKACRSSMEEMSWMFEPYPDANAMPNSNVIRVNLAWHELYRISPLSLDMLDHICEHLNEVAEGEMGLYGSYEEGAGLVDDGGEGFDLGGNIELLLSDLRTRRNLQEEASIQGHVTNGAFNDDRIDRRLGVETIVDMWAIRYDKDLPRYAPLPPEMQPDPAAYDCNDPSTWAILIKVDRYMDKVVKRRDINCNYGPDHQTIIAVPNPAWKHAPFHIAIPFVRAAGCVEKHADSMGEGTARKGDGAPVTGQVEWTNPDWPCNINRNWGFWRFQHRMAYHPRLPELGHAILYRADHSVRLTETQCDIQTYASKPKYAAACAPRTLETELPAITAGAICH